MKKIAGSRLRTVAVTAPLLALLPMVLVDCGAAGKGLPGADNLPGGADACPANIADASAIMSANFGLDGELEGKAKAALAAGANFQKIAADVEADVTSACTALANDLGVADVPAPEGPGKKAEAACQAAVKAIGEFKAKAQGKVTIDVAPPVCTASMDAMANCAAECDANIEPGSAEVQCEGGEISGTCEGKCEGSCTVEAGAKCEGSCSGTCEGECSASFTGTCEGTCKGKCDGKDSKGKCAGRCEGECKGKGSGTCSGDCNGSCSASCTMKAKGECSGSCSGGCDVEIKEPKCSGEVKPPEMSAECNANCDAKVEADLQCTPARALIKVEGAADAEASAKLIAALEKNLPALLTISMGMESRIEGLTASVKAGLEGAKATVTSSGDAALKVGGCFASSLKAQADASVSLNVSVKASASASGEASAG